MQAKGYYIDPNTGYIAQSDSKKVIVNQTNNINIEGSDLNAEELAEAIEKKVREAVDEDWSEVH